MQPVRGSFRDTGCSGVDDDVDNNDGDNNNAVMMMMVLPGWGNGGGTRQCAPQYTTTYRNAKLLRHHQRGWPGPVAGFKARSSQVELPNVRALYFSLSLTPTFHVHIRRMKFCLGRDRVRLISNEHECMDRWPRIRERSRVRSSNVLYIR